MAADARSEGDEDQLLDQPEAGEVLHKPVATLTDWRYRGYGPEYVRMGRSIYYRRSSLMRWIEAQTVQPGSHLRSPGTAS